jgi:hypothetical protein
LLVRGAGYHGKGVMGMLKSQPSSAGKNYNILCTWFLFQPLMLMLIEIIFKNSIHPAKKTQHFTIAKFSWLTLLKEMFAVCSESLNYSGCRTRAKQMKIT